MKNLNRPLFKDYPGKQIQYFTKLLAKMAKHEPFRIVCQGDSMTYGQDTTSPDKRPAKSDPTCEQKSAYSYHEQAGKTYPEALQEFCNIIFGNGKVEIINRGYSGDWAEISKERWKNNPNADLHFIMLGTNDSCTNDYVPNVVQQNITKYVEDMSALIEQILDFGSAIILLTPPKHANEEDLIRAAYRQAVWALGKKYLIPVIDTTEFLISYPYQEVQSDDIHYNSKGYTVFAAKIAGILAGLGAAYHPFLVRANQMILPSLHEYGITIRDADNHLAVSVLEENELSPYGLGSTDSKGLMFHLYSGTCITLSFYASEDHLLIIPLFEIAEDEGKLNISLDFGVDPGRPVVANILEGSAKNLRSLWPFKSKLTFAGRMGRKSIELKNADVIFSSSFLLPRKGYYSIRMENFSDSHSVYFYGFLCLSLLDYCRKQ